MNDKRKATKIGGCLLQSKKTFPQKKILVCGLCPNMSTDVGDLGKRCVAPKAFE